MPLIKTGFFRVVQTTRGLASDKGKVETENGGRKL